MKWKSTSAPSADRELNTPLYCLVDCAGFLTIFALKHGFSNEPHWGKFQRNFEKFQKHVPLLGRSQTISLGIINKI